MSVTCDAPTVSVTTGRRLSQTILAAPFNALRLVWDRAREYRERRDAFRALARLDDRMLDDIGMSRGDLDWASRLPLQINAARELRILAERRRRRL